MGREEAAAHHRKVYVVVCHGHDLGAHAPSLQGLSPAEQHLITRLKAVAPSLLDPVRPVGN